VTAAANYRAAEARSIGRPGPALHRLVVVTRSQKVGRVVGFNFRNDTAEVAFVNGRVEIPYNELEEIQDQR
jgi:hypothetical protein